MCKMAEIQYTKCVQWKSFPIVKLFAEYHLKEVCSFLLPLLFLARIELEIRKRDKGINKTKKKDKRKTEKRCWF